MPYGQCRTELWSWKTVKRLKQEAARIFLSIRSRHIRENWLLPQSEQTRRSTAFDFFSDDQMPVLSLRILILKTVDGSLLQRQKSFLRAKPWPFAEARMHKKLKAQFDTNISSELLWIVRSGIFILSETGTICKHYKNCRYYQVSALKNLEKTSFALPLIVSQGNFSADRAKCGIKQKAENHDLKKLNKLPLVDASCINIPHFVRPARSYASLTAGLVCLHLSADADVRIIKNGIQKVYLSRLSLRNVE